MKPAETFNYEKAYYTVSKDFACVANVYSSLSKRYLKLLEQYYQLKEANILLQDRLCFTQRQCDRLENENAMLKAKVCVKQGHLK
jgi:hypothetical protein